MTNNQVNPRLQWLIGLILICIIYTLYYLYYQDNEAIREIPRIIRHVIKFGTTFSVYIIGTHFLGQLKIQWMKQLWHFIHISLLGILIILGMYTLLIHSAPQNIREISMVFQEFLISPVLYIGMKLLNSKIEIDK